MRSRLLLEKTPRERQLAEILSDMKIKYNEQYIIAPYIIDFYFPRKGLAIEIDGGIHRTNRNQVRDSKKDSYLFSMGIMVLRFTNEETPDKPLEAISNFRNLYAGDEKSLQNRICYVCYKYGMIGHNNTVFSFPRPSEYREIKEEFKRQMRKYYKPIASVSPALLVVLITTGAVY